MRQILWDDALKSELDKMIQTFDTRTKHDWKAALDSIVNRAFPGTGENYQIVFEFNEQAKSKKRKKR